MNDKSVPGAGTQSTLKPYFSRLGIWAFSIGTSIGWGSFVVTCNTYLTQAGVVGTAAGLLLGMAVILVITRNLSYIITSSPDAGGIYTYARRVNGYDIGFLVAWFLLLTYLAVLWANITSLPLFARRFLGDTFEFGCCYTVFGYDVYLGEALLSITAIALVGLLCARTRRVPQAMMIAMAFVFVGGLTLCTVVALVRRGESGGSISPAYIPGKSEFGQIVRIAVISPWAFIGFENVAHFSEELRFPVRKIRGVLLASVFVTTLVYLLMSLLSVTAYPPEYQNWLEYIKDMGNLDGIRAIPAFYAAQYYMGSRGITILMLALLSVILTSMIGNLTALSRLLYALGRDRMAPAWLGGLNRRSIPSRAIVVTVAVSCLVPFLGRTAIGWIVDVTTLGATIVYGFLSYAVFTDARKRGDRIEKLSGLTGTLLMLGFAVLLLAPKLMSYEAMPSESYLLFTAWSLLGMLTFRWAISHDESRRYGSSAIVWIMLLLLMLLTAMMWSTKEMQGTTDDALKTVSTYYEQLYEQGESPAEGDGFLREQANKIERSNTRSTMASFAVFVVAVLIMLNNYHVARKREEEWKEQLGIAREASMRDSLTGVKNKHAFAQWEERINNRIDEARCEPFAIVVCDINNLKQVNDLQGHKAGDECIKSACSEICKVFPHSPVFRFGGDEFVVILEGEDYQNRQELLNQLSTKAERNARLGGTVTAVGMAIYDQREGASCLSVFEDADEEMYHRKQYLKSLQKNKGVR